MKQKKKMWNKKRSLTTNQTFFFFCKQNTWRLRGS
nr:MAG TPA: hypothetical protein [Bacteriophage sp.]